VLTADNGYDITWNKHDITGMTNVKLEYSTDGGSTYNNISTVPNSGTYTWSVNAYYAGWPFESYMGANGVDGTQPQGSFTTPSCAPPPHPTCPAGSVGLSPSSVTVGQTSTASAPSGWSSGSFSSSNNSIATVSGSTITGQSQGNAVISGLGWTAPNGATSCNLDIAVLTVNPAPKSHINLSPTSFSFSGVSGAQHLLVKL